MNDETNIDRVDEIDPAKAGDLGNLEGLTEENLEKASGAEYDSIAEAAIPDTFWKDHPLGRTLSLRNKTGKTIVGVLGGIGSNFIPGPIGGWIDKGIDVLITTQTGVGMEVFDMSLLQIGITALAFLIAWGLPSIIPAIKEKTAWKVVKGRLDDVADEVVAAVDKDSKGGKSITKNEWKSIIGSALKKDESG